MVWSDHDHHYLNPQQSTRHCENANTFASPEIKSRKESSQTVLHDSRLVLAFKVMAARNKRQSKQSVAQPDLVKLSRETSLRGSASLF